MDAEDFMRVLGKTDDSPEIAKLLSDYGVKKKPRIPLDEDEVMIELKKQGVVLVFERTTEPKSSKIQLAGVQLYSDAEKGYRNFPGKLPRGLKLSDTRSEVLKKLGKPTKSRAALKIDIWKYADHRIAVEYAKDADRINVVQLMTLEEDE